MVDVVSKAVRSRMMAGIGGKNTRPELLIRSGLHRLGLRFRLHVASLPGKPDLVFPKFRAVILVNGCFWHGHGCALFVWPASRPVFWRRKIGRNREVDERARSSLLAQRWRVLTVWECAMKGRMRIPPEQLLNRTLRWLKSSSRSLTIRGRIESSRRRGLYGKK